jgi:hypothetical protein
MAGVGAVVLVVNNSVSTGTNHRLASILWALVGGAAGFLMFAPFAAVSSCVETTTGGYRCDQEWSTVLGLTFKGSSTVLPAVIAGTVAAILAWFLVGRIRRQRTHASIAEETV